MIEYAKIMSPEELELFFKNISNLYDTKKNNAQSEISKNKEFLIETYYDYETDQIKLYSDQKKEVIILIDLWNKKECSCGNKLKLIESDYSKFWGCTNYKDSTKKHITFNINNDQILEQKLENCRVRINTHWASDILKVTCLSKSIKAKELIEFYINSGLQDLREKYGYKPTIESISGYVNAKRNSRIEEKEITEYLNTIFPKKQVQMGINYKLEKQNPKVAILDLIVSNKESVYVIEIKRSNYDIKEDQLELYHSLISFILKEKNDNRKCYGVYLVYNKENYYYFSDQTKYVHYDNIKNNKTESYIFKTFNENCQIQ